MYWRRLLLHLNQLATEMSGRYCPVATTLTPCGWSATRVSVRPFPSMWSRRSKTSREGKTKLNKKIPPAPPLLLRPPQKKHPAAPRLEGMCACGRGGEQESRDPCEWKGKDHSGEVMAKASRSPAQPSLRLCQPLPGSSLVSALMHKSSSLAPYPPPPQTRISSCCV